MKYRTTYRINSIRGLRFKLLRQIITEGQRAGQLRQDRSVNEIVKGVQFRIHRLHQFLVFLIKYVG